MNDSILARVAKWGQRNSLINYFLGEVHLKKNLFDILLMVQRSKLLTCAFLK